jgi:hypothetical protein
MTYEQRLSQPTTGQENVPKQETRSNEDSLNEVLEEGFNDSKYQNLKNNFGDGKIGKFECVITLLQNSRFRTIETKEPIAAETLEEMTTNIKNWADKELADATSQNYTIDWELGKFSLDYTFEKDDQEVLNGFRSLIDKNL